MMRHHLSRRRWQELPSHAQLLPRCSRCLRLMCHLAVVCRLRRPFPRKRQLRRLKNTWPSAEHSSSNSDRVQHHGFFSGSTIPMGRCQRIRASSHIGWLSCVFQREDYFKLTAAGHADRRIRESTTPAHSLRTTPTQANCSLGRIPPIVLVVSLLHPSNLF